MRPIISLKTTAQKPVKHHVYLQIRILNELYYHDNNSYII